jgi:hypothetical protein
LQNEEKKERFVSYFHALACLLASKGSALRVLLIVLLFFSKAQLRHDCLYGHGKASHARVSRASSRNRGDRDTCAGKSKHWRVKHSPAAAAPVDCDHRLFKKAHGQTRGTSAVKQRSRQAPV